MRNKFFIFNYRNKLKNLWSTFLFTYCNIYAYFRIINQVKKKKKKPITATKNPTLWTYGPSKVWHFNGNYCDNNVAFLGDTIALLISFGKWYYLRREYATAMDFWGQGRP